MAPTPAVLPEPTSRSPSIRRAAVIPEPTANPPRRPTQSASPPPGPEADMGVPASRADHPIQLPAPKLGGGVASAAGSKRSLLDASPSRNGSVRVEGGERMTMVASAAAAAAASAAAAGREEALARELAEVRDRLRELEADRVVLVQTNTELETQVGLLRQGYEETHAALQAQVGEREREAVIRAECVEENVRLKEEVGTLTRQAAEYKGMCENCLATADTLATLEDEKAYLLAEMRDMKAKAQKQDRALKSAHLHLDSLRSLTTLQTEALQDLTSLSRDACAASARPALMDRQARRDLSARCAQLEKDYTELATQLEHCRAERSRLAGWVERHRGAVDDYAECMKHVDLAPDDGCVHDDDEDAVDDDPPLPDSLAKPRPGPVCRHIARLTRRIAQLTRLNSTHTRLERDHALLQQAVRVERSRSARALEAVERKVAEVVGTCERMREERDAAMVECERVMREVGRAERIGREEVERVRAELEEAVERANASLKSARESYESDRLRFIAQIDEMAVSRKDLEAEIKRIARDKRQLESEMGEMKYKMEVTRQRAIPVIV